MSLHERKLEREMEERKYKGISMMNGISLVANTTYICDVGVSPFRRREKHVFVTSHGHRVVTTKQPKR